MERAALLTLFLAVTALACSGGRPPRTTRSDAGITGATGATTPQAAAPSAAPKPADAAPCDFKVVAMSDPAQKQIRCGNGESFVVRRGEDGLWHEEMKVRAGLRPGYATPDDAGRAHCCPPASE